MADKVLRAPILFFDSNPIGRITTRFSKDMTMLDMVFTNIAVMTTQGCLRSIVVMVTVSCINPYLLIMAFLGFLYMLWVMRVGTSPMIATQRMDQTYQGPINSCMQNMTQGIITFRGYRQFGFYRDIFMHSCDKAANSMFCFSITQRWIAIRLDIICVVFGISTAFFAVCFKNRIDRSLLIFSLTIITDVIVLFSISIRMYTELKNMMVASQRVYEYTTMDSEADLEKKGDKELMDGGWPKMGRVQFDDLSMKYRKEMDPSLKNLTADVKAGQKVGIVGRTGAGKSTIL